jgi:hypothetical protein
MKPRIKLTSIWIDQTVKVQAVINGVFVSIHVEKRNVKAFAALKKELAQKVHKTIYG